MSKWISVAERLPDLVTEANRFRMSDEVVVMDASGFRSFGHLTVDPDAPERLRHPRWRDRGLRVLADITHWTPLPLGFPR